ncbi:MFS transporter [Nocardia cerradoensis]|uniref:Multidrug resistance protein Stp n=1 Tax=Nocardia cerradoensis TaxID=85688 RepID=A0A231GV42_9NOCA|nr:MFS transporter [Nocardia cerradoensis]NKY43623.1 MFS transporter [Nocardia cerradoensis]OXR40448.1 Multidrug resistance protein Stp [Nocardia cerradoensis]
MGTKTSASEEHSFPGPRRRRSTAYYTMVVIAIALVVGNANFEFTLINGAFTNIAEEFRTKDVALVFTVVFVASLVFLPISGKLADIYGKKNVLLAVSVLFAIGCILCAVAQTYWIFLAGRVFQSAFIVAYVAGYGLVRDILPARMVPVGVGFVGLGTGVAVIVGPLLGGYLIDNFGFRSAFWFELGYAVVSGVLVLLVVPESGVRVRRRIDVLGGLLLGGGVAILVFGVVTPRWLTVAIPASAILLVLFGFVERRREEPLIDMRLLRETKVWLTLLTSAMAICAVTAGPVLLSEYTRIPQIPGVLDRGLGWTALQFGLYDGLTFGLVGALAGLLAGWVCRRFAPRTALFVSITGTFIALTIGLIPIASAGLIITIAVFQGVGLGFLYASANNLVIEAVPAESQGIATSMLYTAFGVMNAVGTALIGRITASQSVPAGDGSAALIITEQGFRYSFLLLMGTSVIAFALALIMRHGRTPATGGALPEDGQALIHVA